MQIRSAMNDAHVSQEKWDQIFGSKNITEKDIPLFTAWESEGNLHLVMQKNVILTHFGKHNGTKLIVYSDFDGNSYCTTEEQFLAKFTLRPDIENPLIGNLGDVLDV